MNATTDRHSFDLFKLVIGILIGVSILIFLATRYISGQTQDAYDLEDPVYQQEVLARIKPFGRVVLIGEEPAEVDEQAGEVATLEPAAEVLSGPQVYNMACLACHGAGIGGAPTTGDTPAWSQRLSQGNEILTDHVINGYQGDAGYMPPKGGRIDLSDGEILAAMEYMVEQSQ